MSLYNLKEKLYGIMLAYPETNKEFSQIFWIHRNDREEKFLYRVLKSSMSLYKYMEQEKTYICI